MSNIHNVNIKRVYRLTPAQGTRNEGRSGTQTIERAFTVLKEASASNATGTTVSAIVERTGLNRTTVFRILRCLQHEEAIRYDGKVKRYFLGALSVELGIAAKQRVDLRTLVAPSLTRLAAATGDTVFLMLKSGDDSLCIDRQVGSYPIKTLVAEIGTRRPLGIGAGGLAMLTALEEGELNRIIKRNTKRLPLYGTTPRVLMREVQKTQKAGYVSTRVFGLNSVRAIALPVIDPMRNPIAALSVTAIAERLSRSRQMEIISTLREETKRLEHLLLQTNIVDS